jgi:hypothetical protein
VNRLAFWMLGDSPSVEIQASRELRRPSQGNAFLVRVEEAGVLGGQMVPGGLALLAGARHSPRRVEPRAGRKRVRRQNTPKHRIEL